jgi:hypothetical protein
MKNLQKEKAKAIPQATIVAGVSSQFEKRNRMIRFSSTFFFFSACTHTHTYKIKKSFSLLNKTRLNILIKLNNIYIKNIYHIYL